MARIAQTLQQNLIRAFQYLAYVELKYQWIGECVTLRGILHPSALEMSQLRV